MQISEGKHIVYAGRGLGCLFGNSIIYTIAFAEPKQAEQLLF